MSDLAQRARMRAVEGPTIVDQTRDVENGIEILPVRERPMRAIHVHVPPGSTRGNLEMRLWDFLSLTSWKPQDAWTFPTPKDPEMGDFEISRWEGDGGSSEARKVPYGSWLVLHKGKVKIVPDWEFRDRYEVAV